MWKHGHTVFAGTLIALGMIAASAQTGGSGFSPSLGEALLLDEKDGVVTLRESLLATRNFIIPAGTQLRVAFRPPDKNDVKKATQGRKSNQLEETYSGRRTGISAIDPNDDPRSIMERTLDYKARETTWKDALLFSGMFHSLPTDGYYVAIQSSPEAAPEVIQFRFPEDLLLVESEGAVKIRAVGIGTAAEKALLRSGMTILAVGSTSLDGTLNSFVNAYSAERELAKNSGVLLLTVQSSYGGPPRKIELRVPRSLSNPDDFFSDILTKPPSKPDPATRAPAPTVETSIPPGPAIPPAPQGPSPGPQPD